MCVSQELIECGSAIGHGRSHGSCEWHEGVCVCDNACVCVSLCALRRDPSVSFSTLFSGLISLPCLSKHRVRPPSSPPSLPALPPSLQQVMSQSQVAHTQRKPRKSLKWKIKLLEGTCGSKTARKVVDLLSRGQASTSTRNVQNHVQIDLQPVHKAKKKVSVHDCKWLRFEEMQEAKAQNV